VIRIVVFCVASYEKVSSLQARLSTSRYQVRKDRVLPTAAFGILSKKSAYESPDIEPSSELTVRRMLILITWKYARAATTATNGKVIKRSVHTAYRPTPQ
jgi:hypothetical protein